MRKRFFFAALAVFAVAALLMWLVPLGLEWFQYHRIGRTISEEDTSRAVEELHGKAPVAPFAPEQLELKHTIRLAIGGIGLADDESSGRVSDLVLAQLAGTKGVEMVERQELDRVLRELNLSAVGLVRASDAVRAGKLLRADWFLLGSPTRLNGTNFIVVRIVDARTGILRDAEVFQCEKPLTQLAAELAGFVRQCRQDAADARSHVYLALGGFEDLSVNNRQAGLPTQLRSYLMAAYQKSGVTMLEREFANTLLQEMQMDLAGMTDASLTNAGVMQSAYWMVDGSYQSYEATDFEVELVLGVQRLFGSSHQIALRGKPGDTLFKQAKEGIDDAMNRDRAALTPSRMTEVRAQMLKGKELVKLGRFDLIYVPVYLELDDQTSARHQRNVEEAMRAFQVALLLSPTNREAKMYLAACLRDPLIRRVDEARDIYRQLLDENVRDGWMQQAQRALLNSFEWRASTQEKARWFAAAGQQNSNSPSAEFYRQNANAAADGAAIERGGDEAIRLAEKRLMEAIRSTKGFMEKKPTTSYGGYGMYDFRDAFNGDKKAAGQALARLYPRMQSEFPELAPHLAAQALYFQTDTNTPLIVEYRKQLNWCLEHPREVFKPKEFWSEARYSAYNWLMKHGYADDAIRTLEGFRTVAGPKDTGEFETKDHIALAYAYMGVERWEDALKIFESYTNQIVTLYGEGPWGRSWNPAMVTKQADVCRQKLDLKIVRSDFELEMEKQLVCLHTPSDFLVSENAIWLAIDDKLLRLDFDLKTNLTVRLPKSAAEPVRCLAIGDGKVWVGTKGAGLMEYDSKTGRCRAIAERDGLLMDSITALHFSQDRLWIGYGGDAGGGLGFLDLQSQKFTSYMRSLTTRQAALSPPNSPVLDIKSVSPETIWIRATAEGGLRRLHVEENSWESLPGERVCCFAMDGERLIQGFDAPRTELTIETKSATNEPSKMIRVVSREEVIRLERMFRTNGSGWRIVSRRSVSRGELELLSLRDGSRKRLLEGEGLIGPPTAMALDGQELWVAGRGFIALVDLKDNKIKKFASVPARSVDKIQFGGGYLWALFDWHLHRAVLADLR